MKIDKQLKDLTVRLDAVSSNGDGNSHQHVIKDDEYYLSIVSVPPRFLYYRHIRAQGWEKLGHKLWDHVYDHRITQDELDFMLKRDLRVSPENRYQSKKRNWLFHDCSYYMRGLPTDDESCCDSIRCVPECRYYPKSGRIEDEEVLADHNERIKELTEENAIVDPPDMNSEEAHAFYLERYSGT